MKNRLFLFCLYFLLCVSAYSQNELKTYKDFYNAGSKEYKNRNYTKASQLYESALSLAEKEFTKESMQYAVILDGIADCAEITKNFQKAEREYLKVKSLYEKLLGKDHPTYQYCCNRLGQVYYAQEKYSQAESLLVECKAILAKDKESNEYTTTCENLAKLYEKQGKYTQAEALYIEAKNIHEKQGGKEYTKYQLACKKLATLYYTQKQYSKAEPLILELKNLTEKESGKNNTSYTNFCNNLAEIYKNQGKYSQAELLYFESKNIREKISGKESSEYAYSCNNLAGLYLQENKYPQAEALFIESKNIREKISGKESSEYAEACINLAGLYQNQGKNTEAESLLVEAKNIFNKILGNEHPKYAISCENLAYLYKNQEKHTEAESLLIEANNIYEKRFGKQHPSYIASLNKLAIIYEIQGKYAQAELLLLGSKNDIAKILGKEHPDYAIFCNNLASIYQSQGRYTEAEPLLVEARNILKKTLGVQFLSYNTSCNNLANLYTILKKYAQAEPLFLEANKFFLNQIERNFSNLSEKEKGQFYEKFAHVLEVFNDFAVKRYKDNPFISSEVYNNTLATKALLFNASNKMRERISNSKDESLKKVFEDWKNKKEYLSKVYSLTVEERLIEKIDVNKLENEVNEIEKQLSQRSEIFASQNDKRRYTWQDVQKSLKANEVAIEILRTNVYDKKWLDSVHYVALIVSPESKYPEMVLLKNGKELENEGLTYYKNCIKLKKEDKESYQKYWHPLKKAVKNAKKVYFSGDGVYHQISLLGLKNTETQKYLNEEIEIQLVGNTKDLVTLKPSTQAPKKINILAYPDYKKGSKNKPIEQDKNQKEIKRFFEGNQISMLPGTQTEANQIEKTFQGQGLEVQKFLLEQASEETLKKLENPDILHIATHGFFMEDIPENINENKGTFLNNTQKLAENPLLRSGLLLAGAEIGIQGEHGNNEDGILTAYEAQNLNLDNTQLVVLSACETGQGKIKNGEGVFGLQRAFQTAGAKSILISLWKVDDSATQELMSSFYENWITKKMNKREAFKKAQEEIKKKYTHPYYWAAFVLIGE